MTIFLILMVALLVCAFLLVIFWLFTLTPLARRIEDHERRHNPRLG